MHGPADIAYLDPMKEQIVEVILQPVLLVLSTADCMLPSGQHRPKVMPSQIPGRDHSSAYGSPRFAESIRSS